MALRACLLVALASVATVAAREIPSYIKRLYSDIRNKGSCSSVLARGFHSLPLDHGKATYCGDHLPDYRILYLQSHRGYLANMDVACAGQHGTAADDGRCGRPAVDPENPPPSEFADIVRNYSADVFRDHGFPVRDLNPYIHPYVIFGNSGLRTRPHYPSFDPRRYGIEPLSVMVVVCGDKMIYGLWGGQKDDTGPEPLVGEASISLATACFGPVMSANTSYPANDVLYIAFEGKDAVPGAQGARWNADSYDEFAASLTPWGDRLVRRMDKLSGFHRDAGDRERVNGYCELGLERGKFSAPGCR